MALSEKLKQRFCKDNKLNIQLFAEPYFEERVEAFGQLDKYREFERLINERFSGNEELYFEHYNNVKDTIINYIKASEVYQALQSVDMNKYTCIYNIRQSDVYKQPNIGHKFISIDMSKANFSALVYFAKQNNVEFCESYDWEDFISRFTDIEHIKESKYIRQVVFGNCNPRRQVTYEKYLMSKVLDKLIINLQLFSINDVYSLCSDEIILNADNLSEIDVAKIEDYVNKISKYYIPLTFEYYTLGNVKGTDAYIKKIHNKNDEIKLKCAGPIESLFIVKRIKGLPIEDNDFIFKYGDDLCEILSKTKYCLLSFNFKQYK